MADDVNAPGPAILFPLGTDEYTPPPRTKVQRRAADISREFGADASSQLRTPLSRYWASRQGTATGLLALNAAVGERYFEVPEEAATDAQAAEETFASDGPVIDVQTHWIADRPELHEFQNLILAGYRQQAPDWWAGLDGIAAYTMAEYLRSVFVESETALAVISATPATNDGAMLLSNGEMAGMRELFDRMAGSGRLLNHTVVRPNLGDIERMPEWASTYRPVGWKVYTLGMMSDQYVGFEPGTEWRLDDEKTGRPFLEQARALSINLVCAHKGVSGLVDASSPSDVGPAATAFPDINFVIYHSGYEPGMPEGAYTEETADQGVNRLIETVRASGLGPGSNVYAELGTTWFNVLSHPLDAAHVLGKLLLHLGEDNIVWGTDAIWYGPTQPVLDAFRTFQIPDALCAEYGYPKLSPEVRRKILAGNAARIYGVDLPVLADSIEKDDVLGWTKAVLAEYGRYGLVRA